MRPSSWPPFLERAAYRRRRLGDAARVLPVLALLLVLVPVWWVPASVSYAAGMVWLFGLWAALIVAVWALHRALIRADAAANQESGGAGASDPQREAPDDAL